MAAGRGPALRTRQGVLTWWCMAGCCAPAFVCRSRQWTRRSLRLCAHRATHRHAPGAAPLLQAAAGCCGPQVSSPCSCTPACTDLAGRTCQWPLHRWGSCSAVCRTSSARRQTARCSCRTSAGTSARCAAMRVCAGWAAMQLCQVWYLCARACKAPKRTGWPATIAGWAARMHRTAVRASLRVRAESCTPHAPLAGAPVLACPVAGLCQEALDAHHHQPAAPGNAHGSSG